ncbi:relaxase/mobilization nuclease domain-containing protein [Nocardioides rotundus]|uniref:relaxase/mobilization nuclease domain-containing protein n=1 Tax=Nocardioides rotundus TaxID=1774216 RepID=UPI001CC0AED5|nr:relaxase/mobilization nuclease domain-containing protein [Nocardioides rotundus]UAL31602.1 relaxase/mobilization nuclease domain-containing protein [Nocardioides rotundus]
MSTTHYSPSTSAADTERYIRGKEDERGVAVTCDVPGGPGAFSARARALTQHTKRDVEALHYRQSFSDEEFDPKSPEDVQRVNDLGYLLAKRMHPDSDCLVLTHVDGRGRKPHNHILVINHNNRTGKALSDYRTFHDRKAGNQRGVQSANDELMREHGLSVVKRLEHAPKDWELRREDFAEGGLDREMGDRMRAALADPRAVDKAGLEAVIEEQNQRLGDDERVPRMRLHTAVSKRGKNVGKETWTLYIEDRRGESGRAERRKRTSALSADFTPEGAQAFFDYHQQQKEQDHERSARSIEAAERAGRAAAAARQSGDDGGVDLDPRRRRGAECEARPAGRAAEEARGVREGHGRGDDEAAGADHGPAVDLLALQRRVREDREYREQAERDREHARRIRAESRRREAEERLAELDRRSAEESHSYDRSM